ncbi:MAG: substrate-binding domain-containing protein, partial [Candidatus Cloacimonadales bacterium]
MDQPPSFSLLKCVDNFKGAYEATRHLLELGHERIAYIGGPESFLSAIKRGQGFETALEEIGLKPYKLERGDYEISTGYRITEQWIEAEDLPTAILAGDDHIAFGVINALTQKGYEVPEDISVVGFDDHPFASELKPYLTTVRQPAVEMGKVGVDSLFKLMKDQEQNNLVIKLNPK